MKKHIIYAVVLVLAVFTLWLLTKDGMQPDPAESIPPEQVGYVTISNLSYGRVNQVTSPEDIERLTETLNKMSTSNGTWVDEDSDEYIFDKPPQWTMTWYSPQDEELAKVEITPRGKVYRGLLCFNFLGGDIFDQTYLLGLLLKEPEEWPGPTKS